MSNPGVIILDSCKKSIFQKILNRNSFRYFQIEDNIGESIHLHFDDFRIELSISDFFEVCDAIKEALNNFNGTLIVVSHDREFLQGLTSTVYGFRDKEIKEYLAKGAIILDS